MLAPIDLNRPLPPIPEGALLAADEPELIAFNRTPPLPPAYVPPPSSVPPAQPDPIPDTPRDWQRALRRQAAQLPAHARRDFRIASIRAMILEADRSFENITFLCVLPGLMEREVVIRLAHMLKKQSFLCHLLRELEREIDPTTQPRLTALGRTFKRDLQAVRTHVILLRTRPSREEKLRQDWERQRQHELERARRGSGFWNGPRRQPEGEQRRNESSRANASKTAGSIPDCCFKCVAVKFLSWLVDHLLTGILAVKAVMQHPRFRRNH